MEILPINVDIYKVISRESYTMFYFALEIPELSLKVKSRPLSFQLVVFHKQSMLQISICVLNANETFVWLVNRAFDASYIAYYSLKCLYTLHRISSLKWISPAVSETKTETETKPTQRSQITDQNLRFKRAKHAKRAKRVSFECFVTQVQTRLPKTKCVWPMKINVICTVWLKIYQNHILEGIWPLDLPEDPWTCMTFKGQIKVNLF